MRHYRPLVAPHEARPRPALLRLLILARGAPGDHAFLGGSEERPGRRRLGAPPFEFARPRVGRGRELLLSTRERIELVTHLGAD